MEKYKHIFWDLDHTLWDFEKNSVAALQEVYHHFDLPSMGISDNTNNDQDIVIAQTVANKPISGYITLRKIAGWDTKVENATYGAYDDPTKVGARTDVSGSPDY